MKVRPRRPSLFFVPCAREAVQTRRHRDESCQCSLSVCSSLRSRRVSQFGQRSARHPRCHGGQDDRRPRLGCAGASPLPERRLTPPRPSLCPHLRASSHVPTPPAAPAHPLTRPRAAVRGFSAEGLRKLNAAAKFVSGGSATDGTAFPAARIPTLDELVDEALRLKLGVFIDCKDARTAAHVAGAGEGVRPRLCPGAAPPASKRAECDRPPSPPAVRQRCSSATRCCTRRAASCRSTRSRSGPSGGSTSGSPSC